MKEPAFKKVRVIQLLSQAKKPEAPLWLLAVLEQELKRSCRLTLQKKSRGTTSGTAWSDTFLEADWVSYYGARIHLSINAQEDSRWTLFVALHEVAHINVGVHHQHDKIWLAEAMRLYKKYDLVAWLPEAFENGYHTYRCEKEAILKAYRRKAKRS